MASTHLDCIKTERWNDETFLPDRIISGTTFFGFPENCLQLLKVWAYLSPSLLGRSNFSCFLLFGYHIIFFLFPPPLVLTFVYCSQNSHLPNDDVLKPQHSKINGAQPQWFLPLMFLQIRCCWMHDSLRQSSLHTQFGKKEPVWPPVTVGVTEWA